MRKIPKNHRSEGSKYIGDHEYLCGNVVPIFEVENVHVFNQLVGFLKFINRDNFNVYSRGEGQLYSTILPSLMRESFHYKSKLSMGKTGYELIGVSDPHVMTKKINKIVNDINKDSKIRKTLNLDGIYDEDKIEGMLQHYGLRTRFVDAVDNHWVALWMALNNYNKVKSRFNYAYYTKKEMPVVRILKGEKIEDEDLYTYIVLIAVPKGENKDGITISENVVEVDLRKALPSTFIRPHAQHGIVLRKKPKSLVSASDYDMATNVVGILKIRIDRGLEWLGNGALLTQQALFPSSAYDNGYRILLSRTDIFNSTDFQITIFIDP